MAKKRTRKKITDRSDPRQNRSLAVRNVLKKMPDGSANDVIAEVKSVYGLDISKNMVYMVKTKTNMAEDGRPKKAKGEKNASMDSAADWVEAIKSARHLLAITGSVANATALLKALDA